jgi:ABC-type spermidine/putrescine transport system permease subunit II
VALLIGLVVCLLIVVPLGNLGYQTGLVVRDVGGTPVRSWSLSRCLELLVPWPSTYRFAALWEFRHPLGWTFLIGASAATCAVAIAAPLAWFGRRGGLRALPAVALAAAGMGVMGPLVGIVLLQLFSLRGLPWLTWLRDQTILVPVLAVTWRCVPTAVLICWIAMSGLSQTLLDAATVDGAGRLARFVQIGIPLRAPALAVAWLVSLAIACGELPASILVVPAGVTTVPIRVFGLMHSGVANQAAAICITSVVGYLLLAAVIERLSVWVWRRRV